MELKTFQSIFCIVLSFGVTNGCFNRNILNQPTDSLKVVESPDLSELASASSPAPLPHYPTTFRTCHAAPLNTSIYDIPKHFGSHLVENSSAIVESLPQYWKNNLTEVLQSTTFPQPSLQFKQIGLVETAINSYRYHFNLIIRPDDVWAAIMSQFSLYLNKHAEKLRSKFVNFDGQKELVVTKEGSLRNVSYSWFVNAMTSEIDKNIVDPEVKEWILPNFSTTTENDKVAVGVVFMASMKKYFTYRMKLLCGIPYITLEGTVEDWRNILERLEKLKEYELEYWYEMLYPIIAKFVEAKEATIDEEFWRAIVDRSGGSGVPTISGWITAFCVFNTKGNWQGKKLRRIRKENDTFQLGFDKESNHTFPSMRKWPRIRIDDIPSGIVEVDVIIDDNGKEYNGLMLAGHMSSQVTEQNGLTLQPSLGWAIALKPNNPDSSVN